jgi:RNA polymerase sigma factor (sigma-70 family)
VTRDTKGFEAFFAARYDVTRRALCLVLSDTDLAEDAAQEAFARALERWSRAGSIERPDAWVVRVGLNYARDVLRRRAREASRRQQPLPASDFTAVVDDTVDVRVELAHLADRRREAVVFRYYLDLPLEDVARAMGCALGTAKSTLHAALTQMRLSSPDDEGVPER